MTAAFEMTAAAFEMRVAAFDMTVGESRYKNLGQ